ncbi:MAG: hypothetical protein QOF11_1639 [Chloroflexota bacterium]|jgi:hypothetical protein|nr:hypothetical protein [Chloroflexota bacterium]
MSTCPTCGQDRPEPKPEPLPEITCAYCGQWFQISPLHPNVFTYHYCDEMRDAGLIDPYPRLRETGACCPCGRKGVHAVAGCAYLSDPSITDRITGPEMEWDGSLAATYRAAHEPKSGPIQALIRRIK